MNFVKKSDGFCWLLMVATLFLIGCGEYKKEEREVGYKGLAATHHLLAAQRFAEEMGLESASYAGAPTLPPPLDTTLVLPAASLQSEGLLFEIGDWVDRGGNLIVYLSLRREEAALFFDDTVQFVQPFLDYFGFVSERIPQNGEESAEGAASEAGLRKVDRVSPFGEEGYAADFATAFLIHDVAGGHRGRAPLQVFDYGEGSLTVLGSGELFTNRFLGREEHATLLWDLLTIENGEAVWFIHSTRISFFQLLWEKAREAVLWLVVVLVLFVWWAARGFGPRFERAEHQSARLDEHLKASGAFFRKQKAEETVVAYLRESIVRRLARATNLPLTSDASEIISRARAEGLLDVEGELALQSPVTAKGLLTRLQSLSKLDQQL